jgi:hypothetical protein
MCNRRIWKGRAKHLLTIVLVLAGLALARPVAAGTITVAWDLMTLSNVTGYRVYVGTRSQSYSQTFDVPADQAFFIFRSAFMGTRYYFAVAAQFDNATYGPRSAEVSSVGTRTVAGSLPDGARVSDSVLASDCAADCFVVTDVAGGLSEITSLAVASDGSVFAVEGGRRVVRLVGGAAVPAFEAEPGTVLRDIALDPQYDTTGRVFVSLLRATDRASGDIEVLRLRHVEGRLGEPATIVTGLSVPLGATVPFAVGDDGLVYLALPALTDRTPYSAAVLAFDQDGRVPADQRSPVVARGFDEPADMAWDAQSRSLWLVGRSGGAEGQLMSVSRTGDGGVASTVVAAGETATAVAVASGAARRLLVASGVDLIEAAPGTTDSTRIPLDGYGAPVAVASGAGARYVATRDEGGTGDRVLKVEDGSARAAR